MALKRMDNVGIVVDDLGGTIDFFRELGLELEGPAASRAVGILNGREPYITSTSQRMCLHEQFRKGIQIACPALLSIPEELPDGGSDRLRRQEDSGMIQTI